MLTPENNTSNEISQVQDPDGNRALLGWLTGMMEQQMPQEEMMGEEMMSEEGMETEGSPEALQAQEMPQEQAEANEEPEIQGAELEGKFTQFKEDINKTIDDKFAQLADMIKEALKDDEEE